MLTFFSTADKNDLAPSLGLNIVMVCPMVKVFCFLLSMDSKVSKRMSLVFFLYFWPVQLKLCVRFLFFISFFCLPVIKFSQEGWSNLLKIYLNGQCRALKLVALHSTHWYRNWYRNSESQRLNWSKYQNCLFQLLPKKNSIRMYLKQCNKKNHTGELWKIIPLNGSIFFFCLCLTKIKKWYLKIHIKLLLTGLKKTGLNTLKLPSVSAAHENAKLCCIRYHLAWRHGQYSSILTCSCVLGNSLGYTLSLFQRI